MKTQQLSIEGIPAVLWGEQEHGGSLYIAVHGDRASKTDPAIALFAEEAGRKGHQTLSFDLPGHGERKGQPRPCKPPQCVEDLTAIMRHARGLAANVSLFGCSLGAWFAMQAYKNERLGQALFLSPVVDMARLIQNMMGWFGVSEERLAREGEVQTPAQTLYWDYYQYTLAHPVQWHTSTHILYGRKDTLCEYEVVQAFARRTTAQLTVFEEGEHYFHTEAQMAFYRGWLQSSIAGA